MQQIKLKKIVCNVNHVPYTEINTATVDGKLMSERKEKKVQRLAFNF
jgi:hypothetical protein